MNRGSERVILSAVFRWCPIETAVLGLVLPLLIVLASLMVGTPCSIIRFKMFHATSSFFDAAAVEAVVAAAAVSLLASLFLPS